MIFSKPAAYAAGFFCVLETFQNEKLSLAVFDRMCYNKMNYADNTMEESVVFPY